MGTLTLSGVLKRPISGDVVPNARITFDAIATGNVVLKGVSSSCKTASDGSYSVDLEYGDYTIQVSWAGQTQQYGTVHIDDTTPTGSLNDLLMQELTESQLTPEIVLEFRQLEQEMQDDLAQMEDLNNEAAGSASAAASSATAAAISETNSTASEDASAASASAADASAKSIEGDADAAAASAMAAATSETNAAGSEDAAAASAIAANTSETNAAGSEAASAASAAAAQVSETNSAASETASGASAAAAKTSETNAQASKEAAATSETNAKNARDAADEYAQEAKDAASKVTSPLTDQGQWAIQTGYPSTPDIASVWQITDGGVDPVNPDIIWDPGDMLVYLATTGTWCRLLGQQVVAGEPVPLKIDADIILNVGSGLQIVTSGTTAVDVVRLDTDNNLVLGADALPGICLKTAEPTSLFVLVSDSSGGYTKSRIYSESFPPPEGNYLTEAQGDTLYFKQDELLEEISTAGTEAQASARQNLGLGDAATKNTGTEAGTVAAGDDSRFNSGLTWDDIYPVGSEFSSYTDNRNPVEIIGIGTWTPVVGLIAGVGTATDSQGYAANYTAGYQAGWWRVQNGHIVAQSLGVTLSMNPVSDHQHGVPVTHIETSNQTFSSISNGSYDGVGGYPASQPAGGHTPTGTGSVTIGAGTAVDSSAFFNPYYGKYIWIRIS